MLRKKSLLLLIIISFSLLSFSQYKVNNDTFELKISVEKLRNSKGVIQFTLYTKPGSLPDEKYKKYYKKGIAKIKNNKAYYTFKLLSSGYYAINILHDENKNGIIDKKFIFPKEGIGFSNYTTIGLSNRPKFEKSKFELVNNIEKKIKIIYF